MIERRLQRNVALGFIGAMLLTASLDFLSWRNKQAASEEADLVAHSYAVMRQLEITLGHVIDVETGARGFAATGQEQFLDPFKSGQLHLEEDLNTLRRLTADDPHQTAWLTPLQEDIEMSTMLSREIVAARHQNDKTSQVAEFQRGKNLVDAVRMAILSQQNEQTRKLNLRGPRTEAKRKQSNLVLLISTLLELGLLGLAWITVGRALLVSATAQKQVEASNLELEQQVTELARLQTVLKQSEEQFRVLLDGVKDYAIYMLDPEGRVISWNMCATRLIGYEPTEILGRHHSCFYTAADCASGKPELELKRAISDGRFEEARQCVRQAGTRFWAEVVASPVYDESRTLRGFAKIVHDITDRRRSEDALVQQAERVGQRTIQLEAANKELETFTYSVSHDLRAPLRHINGFSQILLEEFAVSMVPDAHRYVKRIAEGARKMGILVDELLALAGVGRHALKMQDASLNSMVDEVVSILAPEIEGRLVEWKTQELGSLNCDSALLGQVFQNLIANALKFTRPRATAVIEVGRIQDADQPTFFVRDNGVGFDMKYADKLFGVFQRLHHVEEFEGTGIGLATVRRIIQKHGGRAWAKSQLGQGATFYFTVAIPGEEEVKTRNLAAEVKLL